MNFKINLWTLLFVITAGAFYYTNYVNKKVSCPPPMCDITKDPGVISADSALGRIAAYEAYLDSIVVLNKSKKTLSRTKKKDFNIPQDSIPQENRKVQYFRITKPCMLGRILSESTDANEVYAHLALTHNPEHKNGVEGMIDLLFKVKTERPKGQHVDENGFKYYDFTNPCKPLCAN